MAYSDIAGGARFGAVSAASGSLRPDGRTGASARRGCQEAAKRSGSELNRPKAGAG